MKRLFIITLALFCTACNTDWRRKYDEVYPSQNGISMVRKDNKYGLVNAEGTVVAPLKYDYINIYPSAGIPFYDVTINNLYGVIRPSGEELIPAQYNFISYSEGVFILQLNDKKKLLSTNNETLTPWYDEIDLFFGGLARAKQGNKYGYLNTKGKVVLPFVYDDADDFNDSKKAMVKYKGKWGMIDNLGNTIIPFEYEQAEPYTKSNEEWEDYYYILIKKGREVNIDKEGNLLSFK